MTLKERTITAVRAAGIHWGEDTSLPLTVGSTVIQCETENTTGVVCVVSTDTALMLQGARLMVLVLVAAGWAEPESDQWIGRELVAARKQARKSVKMIGSLCIELSVDWPPRLVVLRIEERV